MDSARKADGAQPRQKTQHRMRSDRKEKEHKRLDHRGGVHQNAGTHANATLIYSSMHDNPKSYTHIPSETRCRTCSIPTQEETVVGGPVPGGPRSLMRGPGGPCHRSRDPLPLEEKYGPWIYASLDWKCPIHH